MIAARHQRRRTRPTPEDLGTVGPARSGGSTVAGAALRREWQVEFQGTSGFVAGMEPDDWRSASVPRGSATLPHSRPARSAKRELPVERVSHLPLMPPRLPEVMK